MTIREVFGQIVLLCVLLCVMFPGVWLRGEMLAAGDDAELSEVMNTLHPASIADFAEGLTADETWQRINDWYAERGRTIFDRAPEDDLAEANGWS